MPELVFFILKMNPMKRMNESAIQNIKMENENKVNPETYVGFLCLILLIFLLTACEGGIIGTGHSPDDAVTRQNFKLYGHVSQTQPLKINATLVNVDNTGISTTVSELTGISKIQKGMNLSLFGILEQSPTTDRLYATQLVKFDTQFFGPITNINHMSQNQIQLEILGQSILTTGNTHFENTSGNTLAVGNIVYVSGQFDHNQTLQATWLFLTQNAKTDSTFWLHGIGNNLDTINTTFSVGSLILNYVNLEDQQLTQKLITEQTLVKFLGKQTQTGLLTLNEIRTVNILQTSDQTLTSSKTGTDPSGTNINSDAASVPTGTVDTTVTIADNFIQIEGFVNQFKSTSNFKVNQININAINATIEPQSNSIANGVFVIIEGIEDNGSIIAAKVTVKN